MGEVVAGPFNQALIGWYRFDDPADFTKDYSGLNNHGLVITNGVAPVYTANGYSGGAASFTGDGILGGGTGGKINIPFNTGPGLWPKLTWGGWVLPDEVSGIRAIVNNDDGGYDRALNIDSRAGGNYAAFVNNGPLPYNSGVVPSSSNWTFIAGVYENDFYGSGQGRLTLYVGDQVFNDIRTFYGNTGWTYTSIGGSPTFGEYWDGRIDEFFVIGDAMTPAQMAQIKQDPSSVASVASGVPEPSSIAILSAALAGLGWKSRRRREAGIERKFGPIRLHR